MPTTAQIEALADEAKRIQARDAALQAAPDAASLLTALDNIIHRMMRTGTDPDHLKDWLSQAVDLHDLAVSGGSESRRIHRRQIPGDLKMLFLRRAVGRAITFIQDGKTVAKVTFLRVDPAHKEIDIEIALNPVLRTITPQQGKETVFLESAVRQIITLQQGEETAFLKGLIVLKFSFILEYDQYPPAADVGIEAPQSIAIYRSERLTGLGLKEIAKLRRVLS